MPEQLHYSVELINDKVKFTGGLRDLPPITVDYIPPIGDGEGYTSLELFLMSFGTCAGTAVISIIRKFRKNIEAFKVNCTGIRREEHPTCFSKIIMTIEVKSSDVDAVDLEKAIRMSEEKICPVWAMIKNNVEVETKVSIIRS